MIASANRLPVSDTASILPSMRTTIMGWFRPLVMGVVTKSLVDRDLKEFSRDIATSGVLQPFRPQQLAVKPEGERSWQWYMLHATTDLVLKTDDLVTIRAKKYRVMGEVNYDAYGYVQYELVDDYSSKL